MNDDKSARTSAVSFDLSLQLTKKITAQGSGTAIQCRRQAKFFQSLLLFEAHSMREMKCQNL